jgi:hypothetical protein
MGICNLYICGELLDAVATFIIGVRRLGGRSGASVAGTLASGNVAVADPARMWRVGRAVTCRGLSECCFFRRWDLGAHNTKRKVLDSL